MFLIKPIHGATRASITPSDGGSALLTVIGIMGVASILVLTISTMSLSSLGNTSAARARVQSQAAAEAGIDYAAAQLANSGGCPTSLSSIAAPIFTVTISYFTGTSWVDDCPLPSSVERVKIISTGSATSFGVAGNSSGDVRRVEAIFPYLHLSPIPLGNRTAIRNVRVG